MARHVARRALAAFLALLACVAFLPAMAATKILYPYDSGALTRTPQAATNTAGAVIASKGGVKNYTLSPAIPAGKSLVLSAGTINITLVTSSAGGATLTASLWDGATQIGATSAAQASTATATARSYNVTLGAAYTLAAGKTLVLRVTNTTTGANKDATVYQYSGSRSSVSFATTTFINVDSVAAYTAAWSSTSQGTYAPNNTVYVRATISDPFGAADVSAATATITDPSSVVKVNAASVSEIVTAATASSKTFEYQYTLPSNAAAGTWSASVTGLEGTEGTVTHSASTTFTVALPALTVAKSHAGNFTAGTNGTYSIVAHNSGGVPVSGTTTVTDTLPTGLAYVSGSGTGWSCGAVGQVVTCTTTATVSSGANFQTITLTTAVAGSAGTSVANVATVSNPSVNGGVAITGNTDTTTILHPDLSTSTKTVVDLNGGDADPGDTLRYTITLLESGGAAVNGASVTDDIPAGVTGFTMVSIPAGATNASGGAGANGTGHLQVTGIAFAASGSATVVFEVTVAAGAQPGDTIDNVATIANPNGNGASAPAPTVTVSQSQLASSGNKVLYVYDNLGLTRTPQATTPTTGTTVAAGASQSWVMAPAVPAGKALVLSAGTIAVNLVANTNFSTVPVQVQLLDGATVIGSSTVQSLSLGTPTLQSFAIALGSDYTLAAGRMLTLRVNNSASGNKNLTVYQYNGVASTITFATTTVVNVDSVATYAAAYPSTTTQAYYLHGDTVYVRAVVSDPFGSGDVSAAEATMTDAVATVRLNAASMPVVASDAASKTFEYAYVIPADGQLGAWTASVLAHEGSEGTITNAGNAALELRGRVTLAKAWVNAPAGTAVALAISGGSDAVAGSSTAPSTVSSATASATASAAITLAETYTLGLPGDYTPALACVKDSDASVVAVSGTGLSRGITMPADSSVTCTWTNTLTVPLTLVKFSQVYSDPVNGTVNPKAIPGAIVGYQMIVANPSSNAVDTDTVVVSDLLPAEMALRVADFGAVGSGPVQFVDGAPSSGLAYTFTTLANAADDVDFSNDNGATWTYQPVPDANGVDANVTAIRIVPKGAFNGNNAQFTLKFRVRVK